MKREIPDHRPKPVRILIADDHPTVLAGLSMIIGLQPDMEVVAEATNGREAVDLWSKMRPDVTLLDLRMPVLGGVEAIKEIRRLDSACRIIVLTTFDTDNDISSAMRAGAKGYLLKDAPREELVECIRLVHAGETSIPFSLAAKLTSGLIASQPSQRELEVLTAMARGMSNKEIGSALFISEGTVKTHVRSLFAKLNVLSRTEAIGVASRRGLIQL